RQHPCTHLFPTRRSSDLRIAAFREWRLRFPPPNQERRRMPRVDELQVAFSIHDSEKHGCVTPYFCVVAKIAIDVVKDACRLRPRSEEHTSELQSLTNLVC